MVSAQLDGASGPQPPASPAVSALPGPRQHRDPYTSAEGGGQAHAEPQSRAAVVPQPPALHDKDRRAFLAALVERSLPAGAGDRRAAGPVPESEDPLEEGTAAHSSVLVWRVPWTEKPDGLRSWKSRRVTTEHPAHILTCKPAPRR